MALAQDLRYDETGNRHKKWDECVDDAIGDKCRDRTRILPEAEPRNDRRFECTDAAGRMADDAKSHRHNIDQRKRWYAAH